MKLSTKQISLISVFAALQVILGRLPGIEIIGPESGKIEPTVLLLPIIGIVLGPWVGGLAAFIGNFITWLIPKTTFFGMLMLPTGPVGAIVAGALARNDKKSNWKVAALILLVLNALYYVSPPGFIVPYFPLLHLLALALILVFRNRVLEFVRSEDERKSMWGTTLASFSGVMANHMTGTLIFIASAGLFVELKGIKDAIKNLGWLALGSGLPKEDPTGLGTVLAFVFPISIVERLLMTAISVALSAGIVYTLKRSGIISI
ncbi:MAG: ECF transporter S component [Candidatus Bathyarchaeota archaeon]|jgi:ECF transporter S component (folate family)|nr:ECF transporter S component [Candidatus Bathyarchaeota archaeon]